MIKNKILEKVFNEKWWFWNSNETTFLIMTIPYFGLDVLHNY